MRVKKGIAQCNIEFVVIDVVQKHIHTSQVVGGVVYFLAVKTFFNNMIIEMLFGLQQQRTRTTGRVVNLVYRSLLVHRQLCNKFGYVLWREKLTARFTCIGSVIGNQKLVSIPKQINLIIFKIAKIKFFNSFQYFSQRTVFGFYGVPKSSA